jgi:hypothetical protein
MRKWMIIKPLGLVAANWSRKNVVRDNVNHNMIWMKPYFSPAGLRACLEVD